MAQQEYEVRPPRGQAYRYRVVIPDPPIVLRRGEKTLTMDADWLKTVSDEFLTRNKDYAGTVTYFAGFIKCLKTIGVISVVTHEKIPPDEIPPTSGEPAGEQPGEQPVWAAWQRR